MKRAIILGVVGLLIGVVVTSAVMIRGTFDYLDSMTDAMAESESEGSEVMSPEGWEEASGIGTEGELSLGDTSEGARAAEIEIDLDPRDLESVEELVGVGADGDVALEGSERLARIFGAMKPGDAARVLEKLSDTEIIAILRYVPDRKTAAILGLFDAARAASLSRSVIGKEAT